MNIEKHGDSDAPPRQEQEQKQEHEKGSNDDGGGDNTGVGRSYECTFCKRGFTNAQALGGHMNIHRKDKAKAKQQKNQEETSNKSKENHANSRFVDHHHHQILGYQRPQMSYQVYLPSSNPSFQTGNYLPLWRPERIGAAAPPGEGERVVDSNVEEREVDLELRLGHDP